MLRDGPRIFAHLQPLNQPLRHYVQIGQSWLLYSTQVGARKLRQPCYSLYLVLPAAYCLTLYFCVIRSGGTSRWISQVLFASSPSYHCNSISPRCIALESIVAAPGFPLVCLSLSACSYTTILHGNHDSLLSSLAV